MINRTNTKRKLKYKILTRKEREKTIKAKKYIIKKNQAIKEKEKYKKELEYKEN